MKFAFVNNHKTEATKGAIGICPSCGSGLIAKCGEIKINHWAHKGNRNCDLWWENETEWHRSWKNNFPSDWQEIPLRDDQTEEIHIADVRTSHGLVIEFQHSKIDTQERTSREHFYKNMVWVIDGTRLKGDYLRFLKGRKYFQNATRQRSFLVAYPETCFPSSWLDSSVPVIFDFQGTESIADLNDRRNQLYCLFPKGNTKEAMVIEISHESFIKNTTTDGEWFKKLLGTQEQSVKPPTKLNIVRKKEPTHDFDPRKRQLVKRRRF